MVGRQRFAAQLRRLLKSHETVHTQDDLALKIGVKRSVVSQWLSGRTGTTIDRLTQIAVALDVDVSVLLSPLESEKPEHGPLQRRRSSDSLAAHPEAQGVPNDRRERRAVPTLSDVASALTQAAFALTAAAAGLDSLSHAGESMAAPAGTQPHGGRNAG